MVVWHSTIDPSTLKIRLGDVSVPNRNLVKQKILILQNYTVFYLKKECWVLFFAAPNIFFFKKKKHFACQLMNINGSWTLTKTRLYAVNNKSIWLSPWFSDRGWFKFILKSLDKSVSSRYSSYMKNMKHPLQKKNIYQSKL